MARYNLKLSIIIPYFELKEYTDELLKALAPQITPEVEVILVDDGSSIPFKTDFEWLKVIRKENGGAGSARNVGIEKSKGAYLTFIDADDLVPEYYVKEILKSIDDKEADIIDLSFRSFDGKHFNHLLKSDQDYLPFPSPSLRVFKRSYIGDIRFSEKKDAAEDEDFCRRCGYLIDKDYKHASICRYMYFYRTEVPLSSVKRFRKGITRTKRIVYYFHHVTKDMTYLLEEFKKEDELNEVILMTTRCDIPELRRFCQLNAPHSTWAHEIRGETYPHIHKIEAPFKTQLVIYRSDLYKIGGFMSFILNFCKKMKDKYDITIVGKKCDHQRLKQLMALVRVDLSGREIYADNLIMLSFLDELPSNVHAKKIIRMVHACKTSPEWKIPRDYNKLIFVSKTARDSFNDKDSEVIHNIIIPDEKEHLLLVSATRFPAPDKGIIEDRMRILAKMLNDKGISFTWLNFADRPMENPPRNFHNVGVSYNMQGMIKKADYLVQLSDSECWSYSCLEALTYGTAIICTPFPSTKEMGIKDGINAHIVPFDMDFDVTKLLNIPRFMYIYENEAIRQQWIKILGDTEPLHDYNPGQMVEVEVLEGFNDMQLKRFLNRGEKCIMTKERADEIRNKLGNKYIREI